MEKVFFFRQLGFADYLFYNWNSDWTVILCYWVVFALVPKLSLD
jgi:hypothetical protein